MGVGGVSVEEPWLGREGGRECAVAVGYEYRGCGFE